MADWQDGNPGGYELGRVKAWAERHGLRLSVSAGTQREPESVVALRDGEHGPWLLDAKSQDSVNTAAIYIVNKLERLGVVLDA